MAACGAHAIHLGAGGGCRHSIAWLVRPRAGRSITTSAPFATCPPPGPASNNLTLRSIGDWNHRLRKLRLSHVCEGDADSVGQETTLGDELDEDCVVASLAWE
jgi:hypothetical protein